jgi:DNA-directed RNA polymerase subunit RPC12/RpoP
MSDIKLKGKKLICVECEKEFSWSAGEQAYFHSKQLAEPKRCPKCRKARKDSLAISRQVNSASSG